MKRITLVIVLAVIFLVIIAQPAIAGDGCPGTDEGWIEVTVPEQARDIWDHWNLTEPVSEVCVGGVIFTEEKPSGPCIRVSGLGTNNVFIDRYCPGFNRFSYLLEIPPTATSTPTATVTPTLTVTPTIPPTATSTPIPSTSTATATMNLVAVNMILNKAWRVLIALSIVALVGVIIWIVARNKKRK